MARRLRAGGARQIKPHRAYSNSREQGPLLAVRPKVRVFNIKKDAGAEIAFLKRLEQQESCLQRFKIANESDILLDHNGLVQGRYRLTTHALRQLCHRLVPYLPIVISQLAGLKLEGRYDRDDRWDVSVATCARWLNDLIKLRFDRIRRQQLILDLRAGRVDGFVGTTYAYTSNLVMFHEIRRGMERHGYHARMVESRLHGRAMWLCFIDLDRSAIRRSPSGKPDRFHGGFQFSNSEAGGLVPCARLSVMRLRDRATAVDSRYSWEWLPKSRVRGFDQRLDRIMTALLARSRVEFDLQRQLDTLADCGLGLGGTEVEHGRAADALLKRLKRVIYSGIADRAVGRATWRGSYRESEVLPSADCFGELRCRTVLDLYNAVACEARRFSPIAREAAERFAYRLLLDKFSSRY